MSGQIVSASGLAILDVEVSGQIFEQEFAVVSSEEFDLGVDLILGMTGIKALGGVCIRPDGRVVLGFQEFHGFAGLETGEDSEISIEDKDFYARHMDGKWVVGWKWVDQAATLRNQRGVFGMKEGIKGMFDEEVDSWIKKGWLVPYNHEQHGPANGIIPILPTEEPLKSRVRPVMDYRELNSYIRNLPGSEAAVCSQKLRDWRQRGDQIVMLDLHKAYLQLHIDPELVRYQVIRYKGQLFVMTRMGFGLCVAPKIMNAVVKAVLAKDDVANAGVDNYIDDLLVNIDICPLERLQSLLSRYHLEVKEPESIDGARVLGLRVKREGEHLVWRRDGPIPTVEGPEMTKRELFSLCGKLVGHYPVDGRLRVMASWVKRQAAGVGWDGYVGDRVMKLARCMITAVEREYPVRGVWKVCPNSEAEVWVDASNLATGACLLVDGTVIEDGTWLRPQGDSGHINAAELDAAVKGLNMALLWSFKRLKIFTDSSTVYSWLHAAIENTHRPKITGISEMLVRRRLQVITEIIKEYGLQVEVFKVTSEQNIADLLTRVPKEWLKEKLVDTVCGAGIQVHLGEKIRQLHEKSHLGVKRTLYLARRQLGIEISKTGVRKVIEECRQCNSIDPAPKGSVKPADGIEVEEIWQRVAMDTCHFGPQLYLTLIDCGPSRYTLWLPLQNEGLNAVMRNLSLVFRERGVPDEILTDNFSTFRSPIFEKFLKEWGCEIRYRCANRAEGNAIIERCHKTIKTAAARCETGIANAVMWYNSTPNAVGTVPAQRVYGYVPRLPGDPSNVPARQEATNPRFRVGQTVFVKTGQQVRCTERWKEGVVTKVLSDVSYEVDGIAHHFNHIRDRVSGQIEEGSVRKEPTTRDRDFN